MVDFNEKIMLVSHRKIRTALNFEVTTTLNYVLPVFSDNKFLSSISLNINIKSEMKSFADDYVTDCVITWPVFTV